jgi:hypothetical protein
VAERRWLATRLAPKSFGIDSSSKMRMILNQLIGGF